MATITINTRKAAPASATTCVPIRRTDVSRRTCRDVQDRAGCEGDVRLVAGEIAAGRNPAELLAACHDHGHRQSRRTWA